MEKRLNSDVEAIARIDIVPIVLDVVCRSTGMGFAAIARVTDERWTACAVRDEINFGLSPGGELSLETTICNEIRQSGELVVIEHCALDASFSDHPTPRMYGFQSYISVPITRPNGQFFGTLCAIDPQPRPVNRPETLGLFKLFAQLIGFHLDAQDRAAENEAALARADATAELRDHFIAVLGHDLRSPLASIDAGARILGRTPLPEKSQRVLDLMRHTVTRMSGLIDNILDFARGQLGDGIPLRLARNGALDAALMQVVSETRSAKPEAIIETELDLSRPLLCDGARLNQLFSNLLSNAVQHVEPGSPVRVCARTQDDGFFLAVENQGPPIAPELADRIFEPFKKRGEGGGEGLGLGLYIAAQIARAHGGSLALEQQSGVIRFVFRMPTG